MVGDKGAVQGNEKTGAFGKLCDSEDVKKAARETLYNLSCEGLRTLVMAQKELEISEFEAWNKKWLQI